MGQFNKTIHQSTMFKLVILLTVFTIIGSSLVASANIPDEVNDGEGGLLTRGARKACCPCFEKIDNSYYNPCWTTCCGNKLEPELGKLPCSFVVTLLYFVFLTSFIISESGLLRRVARQSCCKCGEVCSGSLCTNMCLSSCCPIQA